MPAASPTRLTISLDGPLVAAHHLPLSELLRVTKQFHAALQDVAIVLSGFGPSGHGGRAKKFIENATDLHVVAAPRAGSFVIELEVPPQREVAQEDLPMDVGSDLGERAVDALVSGLAVLREDAETLPDGFDPGVLKAIVPFRTSMKKGLTSITFTSKGPHSSAEARLNAERVDIAARLIKRPVVAHATVEGMLEMVDFRALQCRIDRPSRPGVVCFFQERDRDVVLSAVRQFVRVEGQGHFEAGQTDPSRIDVASIVILYEALPFDPQAFWRTRDAVTLASTEVQPFELSQGASDDPWRDDHEAARLIAAIENAD
jgi:hypothetical protein